MFAGVYWCSSCSTSESHWLLSRPACLFLFTSHTRTRGSTSTVISIVILFQNRLWIIYWFQNCSEGPLIFLLLKRLVVWRLLPLICTGIPWVWVPRRLGIGSTKQMFTIWLMLVIAISSQSINLVLAVAHPLGSFHQLLLPLPLFEQRHLC